MRYAFIIFMLALLSASFAADTALLVANQYGNQFGFARLDELEQLLIADQFNVVKCISSDKNSLQNRINNLINKELMQGDIIIVCFVGYGVSTEEGSKVNNWYITEDRQKFDLQSLVDGLPQTKFIPVFIFDVMYQSTYGQAMKRLNAAGNLVVYSAPPGLAVSRSDTPFLPELVEQIKVNNEITVFDLLHKVKKNLSYESNAPLIEGNTIRPVYIKKGKGGITPPPPGNSVWKVAWNKAKQDPVTSSAAFLGSTGIVAWLLYQGAKLLVPKTSGDELPDPPWPPNN